MNYSFTLIIHTDQKHIGQEMYITTMFIKKSQLAWYTQSVEEMTAQQFLEELGAKVNEHFDFTLRR
ncbi:hypothetical protein ACVB78_19305 [Priestia aryabhattai]